MWAVRAALVIAVVASAVFAVTELLPGDAADVAAGADRAAAEELRDAAGLDASAPARLGAWWWDAVRGDLGSSLVDGAPVAPLVLQRLGSTLAVAAPAWALAVAVGALIAVIAAARRGRRGDGATTAAVAVAAGVPESVLLIALVLVLSTGLGWLPAVATLPPGVGPAEAPEVLVLPVLALALPSAAWAARTLRGPAEDVLRDPVVASAVERGVPLARVGWRHVLPRLAPPLAQSAAVLAGAVLGGGAVVESLLDYPGLGRLLVGAVASRDVPVVQGAALVLTAVSVFALTAADALTRRRAER